LKAAREVQVLVYSRIPKQRCGRKSSLKDWENNSSRDEVLYTGKTGIKLPAKHGTRP
jgi:hypothetical protein